MSRRNIILLVVALLIAGTVAFVMSAQMGAGEEEAKQEVKKLENRVLVAKTAVSMGSFIRTAEHLEWKQMEPEKIQEGVHIREDDENIRSYEGAIARRAYRAGEAIKMGSLIKPGSGGFLSAVLEPGKRAISVAVNATSGNAGFIFPGDMVDVILVHRVETTDPATNQKVDLIFSNTFVEGARVVAVDQLLDNPENKAILAKTVTIEVTPKQAESVQVASEMGKISFALRSMSDGKGGEVKLTSDDGALSEDFIAALEARTRVAGFTSGSDVSPALSSGQTGSTVRVLRGNAVSDENFAGEQPTEQPE